MISGLKSSEDNNKDCPENTMVSHFRTPTAIKLQKQKGRLQVTKTCQKKIVEKTFATDKTKFYQNEQKRTVHDRKRQLPYTTRAGGGISEVLEDNHLGQNKASGGDCGQSQKIFIDCLMI